MKLVNREEDVIEIKRKELKKERGENKIGRRRGMEIGIENIGIWKKMKIKIEVKREKLKKEIESLKEVWERINEKW